MDPRPPRTFETLTLPNIAARCFVVRVADDQIRPDTVPAAGTAYNAATNKLPNRILQDIWGSYVYGWPIDAPTDYSAFAFVPPLPTTPTVKQRIDNIWGNVIDHTYYCLRSADLPNVSDTAVSVLGASYSTRYVISVSEPREMSGEVIEVTVTTAATASVTQTDRPVDQETGTAYNVTKTWTVATSAPSASGTSSGGVLTEVNQQSFRLWLSIQRLSTLIGVDYANRRTYETQEALYWPAVMTDFQFLTVLNQIDGASGSYFKRLPVWRMRDAFSDPVKCVVSEWWQKTAPTWGSGGLPTADATMQPSACRVSGNIMSLNIPECLHAEVEYKEQNAIVAGSDFDPWPPTLSKKMVSFLWAATNYTDWPTTFTKVFSKPSAGGYLCRTEVYYKPTVSGGELSVSTATDWVLETHGYWYALR